VRDALRYAQQELGVDNLLASRDLYARPGALFLAGLLDPKVAFGRPVLASCGVTTSVIVDRVSASEEPKALASDYYTTEAEIMDALAYERAA